MNLLVTPTMWGPMSDEQAREQSDERHRIFPCGHCSNDEARVFHNLVGTHNHVSADTLLPLMLAEGD